MRSFAFALVGMLAARAELRGAERVVPESCETTDRAMSSWLNGLGVSTEKRAAGSQFSYQLTSEKIRSANGHPLFNVTGRYLEGARWYSPLTQPNASGWDGELVLTPNQLGGCEVSLTIRFRTIQGEAYTGIHHSEESVGDILAGDFRYGPGPIVRSNGRLERNFLKKIATLAALRHP